MGIPTSPSITPASHAMTPTQPPIWYSVNMQRFIAEDLQKAMDAISQALDTAKQIMDIAIALAKMFAKLASDMLDLLAALVKSIAERIKALLDFFPDIAGGIYMLWIPPQVGGIDYYIDAFRTSLNDSLDLQRPMFGPNIHARAMFFTFGAPYYDKLKFRQMMNSLSNLARFLGVPDRVGSDSLISPPQDFNAEKKYFTKAKTWSEFKDNSIKLPTNPNDPGAVSYIRTKLRTISRDSGQVGIYAKLSWGLPQDFNAVSGEKHFILKKDENPVWRFVKRTQVIHGLVIFRAKTYEDLKACYTDVVSLKSFSKNEFKDTGYTKMTGSSEYRIYKCSNLPGLTYTLEDVPSADKSNYMYAAAFVYTDGLSHVDAVITPEGGYEIYTYFNGDIKNKKLRKKLSATSEGLEGITSYSERLAMLPKFENLDPSDVVFDKDKSDPVYLVGPQSSPAVINKEVNVANTYGAAPDWLSYRGISDLLPEIQKVIEQMRTLIDSVVDGVCDTSSALKDWVNENIAAFEDMLQEAKSIMAMLKSLMFPPMAGVNYMYTSANGVDGILNNLTMSMQGYLDSSATTYNAGLLDGDFKRQFPEEFKKLSAIPAYDSSHITGGMVLMFQDPAFKTFWENLLALPDNIGEDSKKLISDFRLRNKTIRLPELTKASKPGKYVYAYKPRTNLDDAMRAESSRKAGYKNPSATDPEGNVSASSGQGPFEVPYADTFSIVVDGEAKTVVVPAGQVTADTVAGLFGDHAYTNNGSIVFRAKSTMTMCPCNNALATTFGLSDGIDLEAQPADAMSTQQTAFAVSDGDMVVELMGYGKPTAAMRESVPAIFEFNAFDQGMLGPNAYAIKLSVDGIAKTIDVTGDSGLTQREEPARFYLTRDMSTPLVIKKDTNNKFYVHINENQVLVTVREGTYENTTDLGAAVLMSMSDAGMALGTFESSDLEFYMTAEIGMDPLTTFSVQPHEEHNFLGGFLDVSYSDYSPEVPYVLANVVANMNAAFSPKSPVSIVEDRIRITGTKIGYSGEIKIACSHAEPNSMNTAKALFGLPDTQYQDIELHGLGVEMTRKELWVEPTGKILCVNIQTNDKFKAEVTASNLVVEVLSVSNKSYLIELLK